MKDPKEIHDKILDHNIRLYALEERLASLAIRIRGSRAPTTSVSPEAVVPEADFADKILPRLAHQDDIIKRMEMEMQRFEEGDG